MAAEFLGDVVVAWQVGLGAAEDEPGTKSKGLGCSRPIRGKPGEMRLSLRFTSLEAVSGGWKKEALFTTTKGVIPRTTRSGLLRLKGRLHEPV
jgi:hypothetical protein